VRELDYDGCARGSTLSPARITRRGLPTSRDESLEDLVDGVLS
jgi:hypothetical protein